MRRDTNTHRLTTGSTTQWSAATLLYTGATRTYAYQPAQHSREYQRQAQAYAYRPHSHRIVHRDLWDSAGDYSDMI